MRFRLNQRKRPYIGEWQVMIVTLLTATIGLVSIFTAGTPAIRERLQLLHTVVPLTAVDTANLVTLMIGFILLILAYSLWNRKRTGWLLTTILLVLVSITHMLKGLDYEEAFIALGLAGWIGWLRPHFHARSDTPSIKSALALLTMAIVFVLVYGTVGLTILSDHYDIVLHIDQAFTQVLYLFIAPQVVDVVPMSRFGSYFISSVYVIAFVTVVSSIILLTRSVIVREPATEDERLRAGSIIQAHGHSSLAALALLQDKSYYFTPSGSVVAYVVKNGFALALGDPIGPPVQSMRFVISRHIVVKMVGELLSIRYCQTI